MINIPNINPKIALMTFFLRLTALNLFNLMIYDPKWKFLWFLTPKERNEVKLNKNLW